MQVLGDVIEGKKQLFEKWVNAETRDKLYSVVMTHVKGATSPKQFGLVTVALLHMAYAMDLSKDVEVVLTKCFEAIESLPLEDNSKNVALAQKLFTVATALIENSPPEIIPKYASRTTIETSMLYSSLDCEGHRVNNMACL